MTADAGARRLDDLPPIREPRRPPGRGLGSGTARPPEFVTPKVTEIIIRPKPEAAR
jgi:hypothetical protein